MSTDAEFLGLRQTGEPGGFEFEVESHLARHDGHLYGGTAIAVSVATSEIVTERNALWMTTQFVATAPPQETISVTTEILAPGRRTNQVRVTGTDSVGRTMFASLGATGVQRPDGSFDGFDTMPQVSSPEESEPDVTPFGSMLRRAGIEFELPVEARHLGFTQVIEFREPEIYSHPDPGPGRMCFWVRRNDDEPITLATAAFMADMVPMSVASAAGFVGGGISLDNTIRAAQFDETRWILIDMRPHIVVGDYGHGSVLIWSESGRLLAHAGQTCSLLRFTGSDFQKVAKGTS